MLAEKYGVESSKYGVKQMKGKKKKASKMNQKQEVATSDQSVGSRKGELDGISRASGKSISSRSSQ